MECRPAGPADAARIAELLGQLGYPTTAETVTQRLARLDASGADATWVAEIDGEVVGFVGIHISPSLELEGDLAKVSGIVVDEAHRGRGIGGKLMEVAERDARRRGCVLLFLTTAERRKDAHEFYRRLGLVETGKRFAKPLD